MFSLTACNKDNLLLLPEAKIHSITSKIHSLDVKISSAEFIIEHGDKLSIDTNIENLSVSEKDSVLIVVDEEKHNANFTNLIFKLYVPRDIIFEDVYITTGGSKLTVDSLDAKSLKLKLGAGDVQFGNLNIYSNIYIEGGTGTFTVSNCVLNNLTFKMGVGKLDLTASLLGKNNLNLGVGESNITLLGNKYDYKLDIQKGIGNIKINGKDSSDEYTNHGNGQNHIKIEGGIEAIDLALQEP